MTCLVVGASGATGRLLVARLLERGEEVRAIVRSTSKLPAHDRLTLIEASILDLAAEDMARHVEGCTAVASCLGHTLSFKGVFGPPWRLVTESVRRLCRAIRANEPGNKVRFVLMNSTGCRNRDLDEPISFGQRIVIGALRLLVPPHADNEQAGDFLRTQVGQDDEAIEWAAVRPDSLVDGKVVTKYDVHPSPVRSAIFDPGKTSRINVADFMARLMTEDDTWTEWKGRMPVIYNRP